MMTGLTNADLARILPLLIPGLLGLIIPFIANTINRVYPLPPYVQSFIYMALSALAAVVPTVVFDKDLKGYVIDIVIAWLASMRSHYTEIPSAIIPPYKARHAKLDQEPPTR